MITCNKILSAAQLREADAYTIQQKHIASWELMETAATACVEWIGRNIGFANHFSIVCGLGNNGGDGLAIARILSHIREVKAVNVYVLRTSARCSHDFQINYSRLQHCTRATIHELLPDSDFVPDPQTDILIDAIIGTGLSAAVTGWVAKIIRKINALHRPVISIDIPSGLSADVPPDSPEGAIIKAKYTLSFQQPKLSFMFSETGDFMEHFEVLPIGLNEQFIAEADSQNFYITEACLLSFLRKRKTFSHKGTFGHVLIIAGSYGKMGAAVLSTKACLRTGAGLVTTHVPEKGVAILQTAFPEAMASIDMNGKIFSMLPENLTGYNAIGIGPGIGQDPLTQRAFYQLLTQVKIPLVVDADALNILSENKEWINLLPSNTILTPHVKEFDRLSGQRFEYSIDRLKAAQNFAATHNVIVILKGAHTAVCAPDGAVYFNSTGNPGMATAGSGDVLTGIITSLVAQGYQPLEAAVAGVFLHGQAGDQAALVKGCTALIASDIIENIKV